MTPWPCPAGPVRSQGAEAMDCKTPGLQPGGRGKLPRSLEELVLGSSVCPQRLGESPSWRGERLDGHRRGQHGAQRAHPGPVGFIASLHSGPKLDLQTSHVKDAQRLPRKRKHCFS